jgi:flagellar hook-associated protein 2
MATTGSTVAASAATSPSSVDYLSYLGGLSSTPFNPNTVIKALLAADQVPITSLQSQITSIQADAATYGNIATDIGALQSAAFSLNLQSVVQAKIAASSNAAAVTATASPLAQSGSYSVLVNRVATATTARSTAALGTSIDTTASTTALSNLNLRATPTSGSFSLIVDGKIQTITVDTSKPLLDPAGTAPPQGALSQLQAALASALSGDSTAVASVGVSNDKVTIAIGGATATHTISFGASGDSSNFLSMMNLSTAGGTTSGGNLSLASSANVGLAQLGSLTGNALATPLNATTGSFSINGVAISWDATKQSVNDILSQINSSGAGVTAQYDGVNDVLSLANKSTGQSAINMQDLTGNFLAAMNLAPGTTGAQTLGANASVTINGTTVSSAGNTIANAVPGLSVNALALTSGQPAVITVGPDVTGVTKSVQTFVDALNKVLSDSQATQATDASGKYGDLLGDSTMNGLSNHLLTSILGQVTSSGAYQSLQDIGISTGGVGSAVGTTNSVVFDTTKFAAALSANPDQVAALFNGTTAVNGFTGMAQQLTSYLDSENSPINGAFALEKTTTDSQIKQINAQIIQMQSRISTKQQMLVAEFSAMSTALNQLSAEQSILGTSSSSTSSSTSSGG